MRKLPISSGITGTLKRVPFSALVLMAARMVSDQSYSKIRRLPKLQPRNLMATILVNDMLKSPSFPMVTTSDSMDRKYTLLHVFQLNNSSDVLNFSTGLNLSEIKQKS